MRKRCWKKGRGVNEGCALRHAFFIHPFLLRFPLSNWCSGEGHWNRVFVRTCTPESDRRINTSTVSPLSRRMGVCYHVRYLAMVTPNKTAAEFLKEASEGKERRLSHGRSHSTSPWDFLHTAVHVTFTSQAAENNPHTLLGPLRATRPFL
jgi:hypothetical protein